MSEIVEVNVNKAAWLKDPENYAPLPSHQSFTVKTIKKLWSIFLKNLFYAVVQFLLHHYIFCLFADKRT